MNDRFKFRAWNREEKQYHYGAENTYDYMYGLPSVMKCSFGSLLEDTGEGNRYVVEQCTGLKDKNGRLVYEGDIVCWTRAQTDGDVDSICPIVFDNDMCSFGPLLNGHSLWMPHQTDLRMEVLGNIHENPELLEDK